MTCVKIDGQHYILFQDGVQSQKDFSLNFTIIKSLELHTVIFHLWLRDCKNCILFENRLLLKRRDLLSTDYTSPFTGKFNSFVFILSKI